VYTFTTLLNMSTPGLYDVDVVATATGDGNINNDTVNYVSQSVMPVNVPYTTGFENNATDLMGWSVLDNDGTGNSFFLSPSAHSGTQSLWSFENNINTASNDWAFSTCINFTAATNYRITYWKRLTTGYAGSLGLSIGMTQDVAGMTQVLSPITALTANSTWVQDSATFMVPTTGTYYIGFNTVNTNAAATLSIRLDDVMVKEVLSGVGITESSINEISVYPSPSTGVFTVNVTAANSSIEVFNMVGKRIYANAELAKGSNSVDLTGFADGAYFVKVVSGSKVSTQKIVISK
jgi:hypothetical protein